MCAGDAETEGNDGERWVNERLAGSLVSDLLRVRFRFAPPQTRSAPELRSSLQIRRRRIDSSSSGCVHGTQPEEATGEECLMLARCYRLARTWTLTYRKLRGETRSLSPAAGTCFPRLDSFSVPVFTPRSEAEAVATRLISFKLLLVRHFITI